MNCFGLEFYQEYQKYAAFPFFQERTLSLDGGSRSFSVLQFSAPPELLNNCFKIAREKSKFTMDEGQDSICRTPEEKTRNQFKGVLGEMAAQLFLLLRCGLPPEAVKRWDLERETFASPLGEYDIRFETSRSAFLFEIRNSDSYRTTLSKFVSTMDVIGRYESQKKKGEPEADFYIRPVCQFMQELSRASWRALSPEETYARIKTDQLRTYLVAGATRGQMYGARGYIQSMGQQGTQYHCLKITDADDMEKFTGTVRALCV